MRKIIFVITCILWLIILGSLFISVDLPTISKGILAFAILLNFFAAALTVYKQFKLINSKSEETSVVQTDNTYARSYWAIVWSQLKKNKLAIFGLIIILLLILTAIVAPAISHNKAFVRQDYLVSEFSDNQLSQYFSEDFKSSEIYNQIESGQVASRIWSPWFESLFDRNVFPQGIDQFFNSFFVILLLILVFLPSLIFIRKNYLAKIKRFNRKAVLVFILSGVLMFVFVTLTSKQWTQMPAKYYADQGTKLVDFKDTKIERFIYNNEITSQMLESEVQRTIAKPLLYFSNSEGNLLRSLEKPSNDHPLGTTDTGKDVLTVMIFGLRISLTIGVIAVSLYCFIGIVIGALAGYFGGWLDILLSRFIEVMICFPAMYLLLTLVVIIPKVNIFHIMLIIGIISWTGPARLIRGEFLKQRTYDYVIAARALGFKPSRIIFRHILPNAMTPLLVTATFGIAAAILTESGLSFLGLGPTDVDTWGFLLKLGRAKWETHLILPAGFAIFLTVLVFNFVGEGLRDALDPKLKQ